jgi:hypothetical protein
MPKQKLICREVFEAVFVAGKGEEKSEFRANGSSQSRSPTAGRYQDSR